MSDAMNPKAEDAANRLTSSINHAHDTLLNGLSVRDVENLLRVLNRAHESIWAADGKGLKDAIVDEDATEICTRADEVVASLHGLCLTVDKLLRRAEEIRLASADLRNAVELAGDETY